MGAAREKGQLQVEFKGDQMIAALEYLRGLGLRVEVSE